MNESAFVQQKNLFIRFVLQSSNESDPESEPQSIFLEGALPHESQILVSDSKTTPEGVYNEEINGNADEPAVSSLCEYTKKKESKLSVEIFTIAGYLEQQNDFVTYQP